MLTGLFITLCVCVVLVNPTLWGPNVPTRIVITEMFDLFGKKTKKILPMRKTAYKKY